MKRIRLKKQIMLRYDTDIDVDKGMLFDPLTGKIYEFDKDALSILKHLSDFITIDTLLNLVMDELNLKENKATVRHTIETFIDELNKNELIDIIEVGNE